MQRRAFLATSAACCLPVWTARAADNFPVRPVRIVVPYAAGGGPDVQTRQLGPLLGEALGQPIVVENKVGAAGVLAAQVVAAAAPDGYTVLQGAITHLLQKVLQPSLKFDPLPTSARSATFPPAPRCWWSRPTPRGAPRRS